MTKAEVTYPDFSSGELSPRMWGRFDSKVFFSGGRRVENFITEITGAAKYRTGTIFSAETAGNNKAYLYVFKLTETLSFILEFTDQKIRFYRNDGRVTETAQDITGATDADPVVVTYSGDDNYSNGDSVFFTGVAGMTELNGNEYVVANVDTGANTFELSGVDGTTGYGTYTSGGQVEVITEVDTPYLEADLFELKFAQKGVDLYMVHPNHNPRKLTYTSPTSWAVTSHSPSGITLSSNNYPRAVAFYEQRLVYGGSINNPQTLWFSRSADEDNFTIGTDADNGIEYTLAGDGNFIRWLNGTDRFLAVGAFSDILKVTGGLEDVITPSSISIKPSNTVGCADISPVGRDNDLYFMQRNQLVMRSFEYDFQKDSYVAVDRNTVSNHITQTGITQISYQDGHPNVIWAVRTDGVLIGMTTEQQESISGWHRHNTDGEFVSVMSTPRDKKQDQLWACVKRTVDGVEKYFIEYFADEPIFPRRNAYVEGVESEDSDKWSNLLYEKMKDYIHIDSCLTYDGSVLGSNADATMTLSATTGAGVTFTASAGVFSASDVGREIWRKSVTGDEFGRAEITGYTSATVVTCIVLEDFDSTDAIPAGEWFITASALTGLEHLEGKEVTIVSDGGQHPKVTVVDGSVELDNQASVFHVGISYTGYLETNDLEGGGTTGSAQTKRKKIYKVGFRFLDTLYAKYGTGYYNLQQIYQRTANMRMDRPPILFTGDIAETFSNQINDTVDAGWSREKRAIVVQDLPFPCNIQLIMPYMEVSN